MKSFGATLRELRQAKDLTQEDVASFLNVRPNTIGNWEHDRRFPKQQKLVEIADLFCVSLDYLLGRSETKNGRIVTKEELEQFLPTHIAEKVDKKLMIYVDNNVMEIPEETRKMITRKLRKDGLL